MTVSELADKQSKMADSPGALRVGVIDALMAAQGVRRVEDQAKLFDLNRTHYSEIRSGTVTASLPTALRMASVAKTTVEALFGRAA